jgi:prenyltransferase beta subunit
MESHAAYVFCCVGTLAILNKLNEINQVLFVEKG